MKCTAPKPNPPTPNRGIKCGRVSCLSPCPPPSVVGHNFALGEQGRWRVVDRGGGRAAVRLWSRAPWTHLVRYACGAKRSKRLNQNSTTKLRAHPRSRVQRPVGRTLSPTQGADVGMVPQDRAIRQRHATFSSDRGVNNRIDICLVCAAFVYFLTLGAGDGMHSRTSMNWRRCTPRQQSVVSHQRRWGCS